MNYIVKRFGWLAIVSGVLATAAPAGAVTVVTGAGLPESGFSSLMRESDRVLQQFFDASFFASIGAPAQITAMSFRLPAVAGVDYPALGDLNFGRYDVTLAQPSAAAAAANGLTSASFADNMTGPVLVRSGALNVPQGSFESNASGVEADFSFVISFTTPYMYNPGDDLVMLVRHDGHGNVNGSETLWNFDGYAWANGTVVSTGDVDDAVGNFGPGDFNVANRVQFTFVPEPTSLALASAFCLAACGLLAPRRSNAKRIAAV